MTVRITYDGNGYTGGTVPVDTTQYQPGSGGIVLDTGDMVKSGSDFLFWENIQNHKFYWPGNRIVVGADITLSAVWGDSGVVLYDVSNADGVDGDLPIDANAYAIGETAVVPEHGVITADFAAKEQEDGTAQLEGLLTLVGWKILHGAESEHDILVTGDEFQVTDDIIILQAVWGHLDITVSYEMGADTYGEAPAPQYVSQYRDVEIADMPAGSGKSGHRFVRWIDEQSGRIFTPGQKAAFAASAHLTAVWWPNTYHDVVYDLNGGVGTLPPSEHVVYGTRIMLPSPVYSPARKGYTFDGWTIEGRPWRVYTRVEAVPVTSNMVIRARWIPNDTSKRRKITYKSTETQVAFNTSVPVDANVYLPGDKAVVVSWAPAKTGRRMVRWIDAASGKTYEFGDLITVGDTNIELTAVWENTRKIELTFSAGAPDAEGTVPSISAAPNTPVILPAAHTFVREGYFASGWICADGSHYAGGDTFYVPFKVEDGQIAFTVEWIDAAAEFDVTYVDYDRTFGHLPVDPCKYHAGDIIPLAPAGDMRRNGFVLTGWRDVDRGKVYPILSAIEFYAVWDKRDAFDPTAPHLTCRGNYTLAAEWKPATTIAFGSNGLDDTTGFVFTPSIVSYPDGTTITLPESDAAPRSGYACVGWKSQETGHVYPCGSRYTANALGVETFQPVWEAKNIIEYRIPHDLEDTVSAPNWLPPSVYSFGHRPVRVTVPDDMRGRYGWRRSDTGELITKSGEIGEIHGDITLTLCRLSPTAAPSEVRVFVEPSHITSILHAGQEYTFLSPPVASAGWILDNDDRHLYQRGDRVTVYGDTIVRAAPRNDEGIVIEYDVPEGAYGTVPEDTTVYAVGDIAIAAPAKGLRGEKTTKLLYWYAVDSSAETPEESDILLRVYPGQPFRIPSSHETILGAIVEPHISDPSKITLYPMFGDKFTVNFVDTTGAIFSPGDEEEEETEVVYTYPEYIAENQAVRLPRIVKRERDERTRDEWIDAWEYPYHGTTVSTTTTDVYAGTFEGSDDYEGTLADIDWIIVGGWCYVKKQHYVDHDLDDDAPAYLQTTSTPVITTVQYALGYATGATWIEQPPALSGYWFESFRLPPAVGLAKSADSTAAVGWGNIRTNVAERIPWFPELYRLAALSTAGDCFMFGGECRCEVQWRHQIGIHYCLSDATHLQWSTARPVEYQPRYTQYGVECAYQLAYPGNVYIHPYLGNHFDVIANGKVVGVSDPLTTTAPRLCDRWYPVSWVTTENGSIAAESHPAMAIEDDPTAPQDVWLPAVAGIGGSMAGDLMQCVPYPLNPITAQYLKKVPTSDGGFRYEMYYELRWKNAAQIEYHFRDQYGVWISARSDEMEVGDHPVVAAQGSLPGFAVTTYDPGTGRELVFTGWTLEKDTDAYAYYTDLERVELISPGWDTTYVYPDKLDVIRGDTPGVIYLRAQYEYGDTPKPSKKEKEEREKRSKSLLGRASNYWGTPKQLYHQYATQLTGKDYSSFQSYHTLGVVSNKKRNKFSKFLKSALKVVAVVAGVAAAAFAAYTGIQYYKNHHMSDNQIMVERVADASKHMEAAKSSITEAKSRVEKLEESKIKVAEMREKLDEKRAFIAEHLKYVHELELINDEVSSYIDQKMGIVDILAKKLNFPTDLIDKYLYREETWHDLKESMNKSLGKIINAYKSGPLTGMRKTTFENLKKRHQQKIVIYRLNRGDKVFDVLYDYKKYFIPDPPIRRQDADEYKKAIRRYNDAQTYETGVLASLTDAHALGTEIAIAAEAWADAAYSHDPMIHRIGIIPRDGRILADAEDDDAADAACISVGIRKTMTLVDTPIEPDSDILIPTLQYKPRTVTGNTPDEVYFEGDTVTVPDDKRLCCVSYLAFTNQYNDNVFIESNYTGGEIIATFDETAKEPHEEYTVVDCAVPASKRPAGMQFGGWMVDNDTEKVVMPDETILQGMGSHTFTAIWVPLTPPSRFAAAEEVQ